MSPFGSVQHSWRNQLPIHLLFLPPSGWITCQDLCSHKLCQLGRWVTCKVKLFFFTFSNASKFIFCFAPKACWDLSSRDVNFHLALSFLSDCQHQGSPSAPGPWLRRAGAVAQATERSTAGTEVCLPITPCTGGKDSSWVPWCVILDPTTPQRHFCLWMDAEVLLLRQETTRGTSYAAMMLMWLQMHNCGFQTDLVASWLTELTYG